MGIAEDLNVGFTVAAMNPNRTPGVLRRNREFQQKLARALKISAYGETLTLAKGSAVGKSEHLFDSRTGRTSMAAPAQSDTLRLLSLEYQQGLHRAFRRADGALIHSHECKVEVVRRCERDGYCFTLA